MDKSAAERFINAWGEMGSLWGLNSSMARVHALLIMEQEPKSLDQIAKRLKISRGNASMSLKELRNWGVVRRVKVAGDRRDYYVTEPDIWKMFFAIARERKRREFDPVIAAVRDALGTAKGGSDNKVMERLSQMDQLLTTMDQITDKFLENEAQARSLLAFLAGAEGKKKG
jgi:DNA-binding transcriptional regulator GbsR (MarR family)